MPKISVIIPVFRVERQLPRLLDSLLSQTCADWEALCVDDGSDDGSGAILDRYAATDGRFLVFHGPNGGVSQARNTALEAAAGDFLLFADGDDFLHPQLMELCLYQALRDGSDLVAFTYDRTWRTVQTLRQALGLPERLPRWQKHYDIPSVPARVSDDVFSLCTEYAHPQDIPARWAVKHCQPWRCLYRRDRIGNLRFLRGIIYEDFPWWTRVLLRCRRITVNNLPLYYYYPNFKGYIHSAPQAFRIESLEKAIADATEAMLPHVGSRQWELWDARFLRPFQNKLDSKRRKMEKERI